MSGGFAVRGATAVLTGAGSGLGAATAELLAARGCNLALCDINEAGLAATAEACAAKGVRVSRHVIDVGDARAVAELPAAVAAEHGQVSVLINNAGVAIFGRFDEMTMAEFDWLLAINLYGVVRMTHAFLPALKAAPAGHIVNISSIFGIVAPPGQTAYCASKFGVRGFSESLRHELAGSTVSLTVVHPGGFKTKIGVNARVAQGARLEDLEKGRGRMEKLLSGDPAYAAQTIVEAIERRSPRLIIGNDAKIMAWLQRLFPVTYWKRLDRMLSTRG